MTILTSIILVVAVVAIALFIAYNAQRGTKALSEFKADYDNNAEVQEVVELAQELYNKDLRPIVAKKAPKKTKAVEQVEVIAEVVTPEEVTANVEALVNKATGLDEAPISTGNLTEPTKPKKKRKYYPRKPKTSI
jgi:L-rhamnose isomerase